MKRIKHDGATLTYYNKKGTLCIQGKEGESRKIRTLLVGEDLSMGKMKSERRQKQKQGCKCKRGGMEQARVSENMKIK